MILCPIPRRTLNLTEFMDLMLDKVSRVPYFTINVFSLSVMSCFWCRSTHAVTMSPLYLYCNFSAAALFNDVQPFVQSALDGSNVSIFAYGQTNAGKTYTMVTILFLFLSTYINGFFVISLWLYVESTLLTAVCQEGSNHDRGLYARCFEELFDLSNSDSTSTSRFSFSLSVFEIHNEQVLPIVSEVLILLAFIFFAKMVLQWNPKLLIQHFSFSDQGFTFGNS